MNDPYPALAPALPGRIWLDQFWGRLTFLHWRVRPEDIAHLLPAGTRPDVFDGDTFVALVPFEMSATKIAGRLPLPYFGTFPETNVRLYSIDDAGRHGVVFLSLETARLAVVGVTRGMLGVPYTWARMKLTHGQGTVSYTSCRRWPKRGLCSTVSVTIGDVVEPTELEVWLTARWGAHTRKGGRTWWVPNQHDTWPVHAAEVTGLDDELIRGGGVSGVGERLRPLYSPGVRAQFGRPILVS